MTHLTYLEAAVVGLIQGVTELFPISSLGHNVLLPAIVGGSWATDLNVAAAESPYLAFIVGLHVATAIALLIYFWRDWVRIIKRLLLLAPPVHPAGGGHRQVAAADGRPAARLDDHPGDDPGRAGRARVRARVPGAVRQAHPGRDLPGHQRPDPAGRGVLPPEGVGAGGRGDRAGAGTGGRGRRAAGGHGPARGRPPGRAGGRVRAGDPVGPAAARRRATCRPSSSARRRSWRCWPGSAGTGSRWWRACSAGCPGRTPPGSPSCSPPRSSWPPACSRCPT